MGTYQFEENLKAYYNVEAAARNERDREEWQKPPRDTLLKMALEENKSSLLEIGAGAGKDSQFFAHKGLTVTAVDFTPEMVKLCREKGLEAYEMDFSNLSGLGRKFDCCWAMNSLLHIKKTNLAAVLEGISNILNPEGLFYMGVYGGEDWEGFKTNEKYTVPRFFSFFSDESLRQALSPFFSHHSI